MKSRILNIVMDLRPDVDFENETKLIDDSILDSFDIVSLVFELNDEFDLSIDVDELVPDNFNSVDAMVLLVEGKLAE